MLLKFGEGVSSLFINLVKNEIKSSLLAKIGAIFMFPSFKRIKKLVDYEEYGGALLLGLKGVCVKAHGRANAFAIKNAIIKAADAVNSQIINEIRKT